MTSEGQMYTTDEISAVLAKVDLFEGLPDDDLERIANIVGGATAEAGEVLFEEGESGDAFYVVVDGAVEIVKRVSGGDEEKLAVRRRGEAFGEMALLNDAPRSATARAVDDTQLMVVPRDDFLLLLGADTLAVRVMQSLSKALRALGVRFATSDKDQDGTTQAVDESAVAASRALQRSLMPKDAPRAEGYDLAAGTMLQDTGHGDTSWVDLTFSDGRTGMACMTIQGNGPLPAYRLALGQAFLREAVARESSVERLLSEVNGMLTRNAVPGSSQHVACAVLVPGEGGVTWSSGGGIRGAVIRRDGTLDEFPSHGPPLGMLDGFKYGTQTVTVGAGDMVIVLSKGSTGMFRGAADLVSNLQQKPAGEVVSAVHKALRRAQGDDAVETTVLFIRKH
ncbi:MAG: cyclic nucleotide-binding domain-containing protein [Longimicrobiales bacterium]